MEAGEAKGGMWMPARSAKPSRAPARHSAFAALDTKQANNTPKNRSRCILQAYNAGAGPAMAQGSLNSSACDRSGGLSGCRSPRISSNADGMGVGSVFRSACVKISSGLDDDLPVAGGSSRPLMRYVAIADQRPAGVSD